MSTLATSTNLVKAISTVIACKNIKGTSFVGVRNYTNKEGEISNQTFVVGIDYNKLLENDLQKLENFDISKFVSKFDADTVKLAYTELLTSLRKRLLDDTEKARLLMKGDSTIVASQAQKDAYIPIAKGLKSQDGFLYVYGLMVRKQVLQAIEYKKVNSAAKTLAKKEISKAADLRELKYKMFKLGKLEELKISGITI